ncbi:acyltransferase family protein [Pseudoalteromonas sp.]|uniref:acyltransferase family protein n=1 Tax=Pseudoalteromonas sp. TaxID=53249 RepID=UPI0030027177
MKINSFNHFRAIAIILIIAGHSFGTIGMEFDNTFDITLRNLIAGGTSLFVFISGFLFHHIFYPRYKYKKFLTAKFLNVFLPYLLLSFVPIFLYVSMKKDVFGAYFLPNGSGVFNEYLVPTFKYYLSGRFLEAYWYIPFIMITFLLSPLHMKYIRLTLSRQLVLIFGLSVVAIFMHRPVANIHVLQSVLYFSPVYLIGITASIHKEFIYEKLRGKELYLLGAALLIAYFQASLGYQGNYHKPTFEYGGIDLMYFQKFLLCFFFMIWLNRFENYDSKIINYIALTSFTAFFIHPFIIWALSRSKFDFLHLNSWLVLALFVLSVALICALIAKLMKKIIPKHSRYIIGY